MIRNKIFIGKNILLGTSKENFKETQKMLDNLIPGTRAIILPDEILNYEPTEEELTLLGLNKNNHIIYNGGKYMEIIKLENYKEDCVCAVKNKEVKYIDYPDKDEILEYIRDGFKIYGVIPIKVFDDNFIENDIQSAFETQAENEGYEDMNDFIDYNSEEFKKVKEAVKNFIKSLGNKNIKYKCDENTVIEVDIPKCKDCIHCNEFSNGELYCQDKGFYIEDGTSCSFFKEKKNVI